MSKALGTTEPLDLEVGGCKSTEADLLVESYFVECSKILKTEGSVS